MSYAVDAYCPDRVLSDPWVEVCRGSRQYCQGFVEARREVLNPRPPQRVRRLSDGAIVDEIPEAATARLGMICGWPTVEQLFRAARTCLRPVANGTTGGRSSDGPSEADRERARAALVALGEEP